ncbi:restriction endonuclease subunit S [Clostridium perfringens]|nr:restriction endonuclease subunit S [Clostridium perfringens]
MEYTTLGEVCTIKSSKRIYQSDYLEKGIPFYRGKEISQLSRGEKLDVELYISENKYSELKDKFGKVQKGDLLITSVGTIGNTWVSDGRDFYYKDGNITQIVKNDNINTKFLHYLFKSNIIKRQYSKGTSGTAQVALTIEKLKKIKIPKVPLEYQIKTVKLLEKSQELIDKRKEQVGDLDLLVKSKFIEMFGNPVNNDMKWDKVVCNDITSKIGSGATPKGGNSSYKEQGISLIRSMNVHNNTFLVKDLAFIDDKQAEKLKNVIVKEDDILLNITGASVARCCKVPKDIIPARVNQHVAILRCDNEKINPSFMEYQFTNESYQRLLWDIATSGGATREAITKQQIQMLEVILPPIELQNQFAEFVNQVYKLKFEMEKSLKELEDNFNSLMQKAFKGELFN